MPAKIIESLNPRDKRTEGEEYLLNVFKTSKVFNGWQVFEQPHINSMKPDFVLTNPKKGIIIIEVKDWNLESKKYINGGYILGDDGKKYKKSPINQVEGYKNCILKMDWEGNEELVESYGDYYGYIETVVFFYGANRKEVKEFCYDSEEERFYNSEKKHTKIWTIEDIEYIKSGYLKNRNRYPYALLNNKESKFNENNELEHLVEEISAFMKGADYREERRKPMILNPEQNKLAELKENSTRRWKGVAGSGKSLILAEKATRALKKGKNVLLLTYNITLRHYLRDLCSTQFGTDSKDDRKKLKYDLKIIHFHGFLKELFANYEIEPCKEKNEVFNKEDKKTSNEEKGDFTLNWIKVLNKLIKNEAYPDKDKYDYILIDEGQDFQGEWILFLKQFFSKKGEVLVVYDEAQDIYGHGVWIEDPKQIKNIGFKGQVGKLRYSERMPKEIINKIQLLRRKLNINEEEILIPKDAYEEINFLSKICWLNEENESLEKKMEKIYKEFKELKKNGNAIEDITILTTNENTGIEIVKYFEERGVKVSHVYDMSGTKNIKERRKEKFKFQGGTGRLKVCSFQSYKGWQTPNVILVLDDVKTYYKGDKIEKRISKENNLKINSINNDFDFSGEDVFEIAPDTSNSIIEQSKIINDALFISMSRVKQNTSTGEYAFICLNYLDEYKELEKYFD